VLSGHEGLVTQVAFSAANNLLASIAWDEIVRIWEPISGKQLIRLAGTFLQLSADGRRLAFKAGERLERWELVAPSEYSALRSYEALEGTWSADFSPDDRLLASAHSDGLRIWDLSNNKEIAHIDQTEDGDQLGYIRSVVFHPDGTKLITCGPGAEPTVPGKGGLYIWSIESGPGAMANALQVRKLRKIDLPKDAICEWAALSDKGRILVVADGGNGQVMLRDLNHPAEWTLLPATPLLPETPLFEFVATNPDGRWIAYVKRRKGIWVMDSGTNNSKQLEAGTGDLFAAFSPNGKGLVTGLNDYYHVWRVGSLEHPVHTLAGYHGIGGLAGALAFSPDGTMLAIVQSPSEVELVDTNKGWEKIVTLTSPDSSLISRLRFSPDGSHLAVVTAKAIYIWDLRAIRQQLAKMDLDWPLPAYPALPPERAVSAPARRSALKPLQRLNRHANGRDDRLQLLGDAAWVSQVGNDETSHAGQ
jgi:WD40 repeat protein